MKIFPRCGLRHRGVARWRLSPKISNEEREKRTIRIDPTLSRNSELSDFLRCFVSKAQRIMVKEVESAGEFAQEIKGPGLVVCDYFATWCGPCKAIAPFIEELSKKYPSVKFIKLDVDKVEEVSQERGVKSYPTFQFFLKGEQVDEMSGANTEELEGKVKRHQVETNPFAGKGFSLKSEGSGGADQPPLDPRAARLKAFGGGSAAPVPPVPVAATKPAAGSDSSGSVPMNVANEDDEIAQAVAASLAKPSNGSGAMEVEKAASGSGSAAASNLKKSAQEQDAADLAEAEAAISAEDQAANDQIWGEEMGKS